MDNTQKLAFKSQLKQFGLDLIAQRIAAARQAADQAQEAANQEEKSSAGDKYETGRAMGQLQKEMHARQQAEHEREHAALLRVRADALCTHPVPGAFIQCQDMSSERTGGSLSEGQLLEVSGKRVDFFGYPFPGIFICAGLGKHSVAGQTILFLSPAAPLAKSLLDKKTGDEFSFNGRTLRIEDLF
ncbi:hypothetical protein Q4E93_22115 [Flavitalea sp. BT771]|uniref:hypothetical protein n=1 Tax=Flavitalea sp. BT771 TaxID=3063329 RepID=UPI0026E3CCF2|nr:hypothetical protein [Flavitalea sp. BT771]MDO6433323.1 hypothetical protein [Flavitalea sp. BT771]MDV6222772.1 hypothetical protein [Flavitalea sp. BT771]